MTFPRPPGSTSLATTITCCWMAKTMVRLRHFGWSRRPSKCRRPIMALTLVAVMGVYSLLADAAATTSSNPRELFVPDGAMFVTFYDLPSRRFRSIRDAFIVRNFETASADLLVSENYLSIEATRADSALQPAFVTLIERLQQIRSQLLLPEITATDLDKVFARAHWLLSQHFLGLALIERDQGTYETASWYLIACAHHMERTVLWSNARINKNLETSLEQLYALANQLGKSPTNKWVKENRPIVSAARTLHSLGQHLDRRIEDTPASRLPTDG